MGFWEKLKEFDKMMSEPIEVYSFEQKIQIPDTQISSHHQVNKLLEENKQLRALLDNNAVEVEPCKQLN